MTIIATLCYVIQNGKVLLAQKKKGFGEGKWNGPGGKVKENEDIVDAVKREVFEEVNIVPESPQKTGELEFYYGREQADEPAGPDWIVHIFVASEFDGIEKESPEVAPKWFSLARIPYDTMWPDDKIWMPLMLQGRKFKGKFYFDKDNNIIKHDIEVLS